MLERIIPSSGEGLPVIGLGTWQTFDVANAIANTDLKQVLERMHVVGGKVIDSSPMYGRAEQAVGILTSDMGATDSFFYATKVWTTGKQEGIRQMESSLSKTKRQTMDLMQIHNLTDWQTHLPVLRQWKAEGKIRYIGITHYTDSSHAELERIMRAEKVDFVQFNYSIGSRHAEQRLLTAAADLGVATLINRPLGEGNLFRKVAGKPLPGWAKDMEIDSWAGYFLKYIIGHPAVTCVIPATANPLHATDNLNAGFGKLSDEAMRRKMADHFDRL